MVAGNVIGSVNDPVDELPIIAKFKEIFHDRVVAEIVWSGASGPAVQSDPKVAAAFGGTSTITSTEIVNLGPRDSISFIAVGGGGGGGHGREDGYGPIGDRKGGDGTSTTFEFRAGSATGTLIKAYDLSGGAGGASGTVDYSSKSYRRSGQHVRDGTGDNVVSTDPQYGFIGTGGVPRESSSGTSATGYGAGGGGGGGDNPSIFDSSGGGGFGGKRGTFKEATINLSSYSGQAIYLVVTQMGSGGAGAVGGGNNGGNGAPGAIYIKEQIPSSLPSSGPTFNEQDLLSSLRGTDHLGMGYKIDGNKIFDVFLAEANKYTNIRKLRVVAANYDETQVSYMGPQYRTNIDVTTSALVTSENDLDPAQLNEDETIVQYFNNLYDGWALIRDDVILNGVIGLGTDPLPTFDVNTGLFSSIPTSVSHYTTSQSWSSSILRNVALVSVGAGGAGGVGSQSYGGGGGGVSIRILQVVPGETYNFNIGSGGVGGTSATGADGGNTSITGGSLSSTIFGAGGLGGANTGDAPANGGSASGGNYNIDGGNASGAGVGQQTAGGPAGGPNASVSQTSLVLSTFTTSSSLVRSNGKVLCGYGAGTGANGGNFGGGGGASSTTSGSGSGGVVAVFFF